MNNGEFPVPQNMPIKTVHLSALVYVIDNSDSDRVSDVCADIKALLEDRDLKHLPLLLVLSKLDISGKVRALFSIVLFKRRSSLLSNFKKYYIFTKLDFSQHLRFD